MPNAIHFGAGNIGRGFIGPVLFDSGYHVTFADVNEALIDSLNSHDHYTVHVLSHKRPTAEISDFSGVVSTSPDVLEEFLKSDLVTTSVGAQILPKIAPTIAKGLKRVYKFRPHASIDIIACENGVGASEILRKEVKRLFYAETDLKSHGDEKAAKRQKDFFDNHVGFANCSVDRIVPPFDPAAVAKAQGDAKEDHELDVGVEDFFEWVVDKNALKSDHHIHGMRLAKNLLAYVERKLFTLNTAHATISYLGYLKGYKMVHDAINDPQIFEIVRGALDESGRGLLRKHSKSFTREEQTKYVDTILEGRLKNPNVQDEISRVCRCPMRKLSRNDRLIGPAMMAYEYGCGRPRNLVKGIAAALWYDDLVDEDAQKIRKMIGQKGVEMVLWEISGLKRGDAMAELLVKDVLTAYEGLKSELGVHPLN